MKEAQKNTVPALSSEGAAHHPYGPSRWPSLLSCPCWESKPPTEQTERGTALHALFERAMKGEEVEAHDALEWNVLEAARTIRRREHPDAHGFLTEQSVWIPGTMDLMSGRLDVGWIDSRMGDVHVADLKLSCNPERDHTPQLLAYAMAILAEYGKGQAGPRICLHMLYADGSEESVQIFKTAEAIEMHLRNAARIRDIMAGEANMTPRQCGWCDLCAKFTSCQAVKAVVDKAGPKLAEAAKPEVWADYTPAKKAQLCALADTLAKWCVAVKENAAADAKDGKSVQDADLGIYYGLQPRAGKWTATPDEAWAVLRSTLPREQFTDCLSLSASKLKAKLRAVGKSPKEIEALLEAAGTRGEPSVVFVRKGLKESA